MNLDYICIWHEHHLHSFKIGDTAEATAKKVNLWFKFQHFIRKKSHVLVALGC